VTISKGGRDNARQHRKRNMQKTCPPKRERAVAAVRRGHAWRWVRTVGRHQKREVRVRRRNQATREKNEKRSRRFRQARGRSVGGGKKGQIVVSEGSKEEPAGPGHRDGI